MKYLISLSFALFSINALTAQIPGASAVANSYASEGTTLGANDTIAYNGISLGNRVKLRGYVDFVYGYGDVDALGDDSRFSTSGDVDFLFDFSPVTGEVHLQATTEDVGLEQLFGRYSFNQDFNLSFGRQLTNLGYEADEAPGLFSTSYGYFLDVAKNHDALKPLLASVASAYNNSFSPPLVDGNVGYQTANSVLPALRRNYVDGIRANFNNGQFGLSLGLHDGYWTKDDFNDHVAIDIAASVVIIPGLEARLGYAHQDLDDSDIGQINTWVEFSPGDLTLAFEYDYFDFHNDSDLWDLMILGNYQFTDLLGLTLRYSHEDGDNILLGDDYESDRITLALLFSITQQFGINFEYSHTDVDIGDASYDADEVYLESLFTF